MVDGVEGWVDSNNKAQCMCGDLTNQFGANVRQEQVFTGSTLAACDVGKMG